MFKRIPHSTQDISGEPNTDHKVGYCRNRSGLLFCLDIRVIGQVALGRHPDTPVQSPPAELLAGRRVDPPGKVAVWGYRSSPQRSESFLPAQGVA